MKEERQTNLENWLDDISKALFLLKKDAFEKQDVKRFRARKASILIHFIAATTSIEEELEDNKKATIPAKD